MLELLLPPLLSLFLFWSDLLWLKVQLLALVTALADWMTALLGLLHYLIAAVMSLWLQVYLIS